MIDPHSGKTALDAAVALQRWNIVEILVGVGAVNGNSLVKMVGVYFHASKEVRISFPRSDVALH